MQPSDGEKKPLTHQPTTAAEGAAARGLSNPFDFTDIALRKFQEEDYPFFVKKKYAGIWYEPRLGKTVQSLRILTSPDVINTYTTAIIACPTNAVAVWYYHILGLFEQWAPTHIPRIVIVREKNTSKAKRQKLWRTPRPQSATQPEKLFFICVRGSFLNDIEWLSDEMLQPEVLLADEYERWLKNRKTKSHAKVERFLRMGVKRVERFHPMTGTPVSRGPQEWWGILHLLDPGYFRSYWKWVNMFCVYAINQWGAFELLGIKNTEALHDTLNFYGRQRLRKDVAPHMPTVSRYPKPVSLTPAQEIAYKAMEELVLVKDDGDIIVASGEMEATLRLRQLLACPIILGINDLGGAILDILQTLEEIDNPDERHVVIYTPFRKVVEILARELYLRKIHAFEFAGGLDPFELQNRLKQFRESKGVAICTIAYAQAFSFAPAYTTYFVGYEWDPNMNKQAEDRLIPQEGLNPITAFYYTYESTVDLNLMHRVITKHEAIGISYKDSGART
jgi:SNF2 family DNA or RNA helicase